jgi:hypothetical protein
MRKDSGCIPSTLQRMVYRAASPLRMLFDRSEWDVVGLAGWVHVHP